MRTIAVAKAFKMPLDGISFPLAAFSGSSAAFRNFEKTSCADDVNASGKTTDRFEAHSALQQGQACKGLLPPDRKLSGHHLCSFSGFQVTYSLCHENLYRSDFTAVKSCNGSMQTFAFCKKYHFKNETVQIRMFVHDFKFKEVQKSSKKNSFFTVKSTNRVHLPL